MDRIGTIMGAVTIPMALLTVLAALSALWLMVAGQAALVLTGIGALIVGIALAWAVDHAVAWCEDGAMAIRRRFGAAAGQAAALLCGIAPMVVLLGWEYASFDRLVRPAGPTSMIVAVWLLSYGVATGPWTAHAQLVGHDRRTLCGIRAYAGHLAYWLLGAAAVIGAPKSVGLVLMALPAILPVTVGALLAVADREALRNVRI